MKTDKSNEDKNNQDKRSEIPKEFEGPLKITLGCLWLMLIAFLIVGMFAKCQGY